MMEIRVSLNKRASNFDWAVETFPRGDYNPARTAAMDMLMQAGRRDVSNFNGNVTRADLCTVMF
ncbi:MAG: hypothetical protein OXF24_06865 [Hyphomicrobiales bacterium]|nr:hypothetical protein [Hyphomicrobiales bacterium]